MRDHLDRLGDTLPVVVTFTDQPARLAAYRTHLGIAFPVVADLERHLYQLLGARRGSLRQVWSPGTIATYARLLRQGRRLRRPREDTRQLGADVIVDHDGRIHRIWRQRSPDTRPAIDEIIDTAHKLNLQ